MTKFFSFLLFYCLLFSTKIRSFISVLCPKQRVITKADGVQATTIEGQNAFAPVLYFMYTCKFHVTDGQNMLNQITSGRRSKRAWSKCILCILYILSGSPNKCWLHPCDACVITTWRLRLRAPLATHNYLQSFYLLISWFGKFTTWAWRLSFAVQYHSKVSWHLTLNPQESRIESSQLLRLGSRFLRDSSIDYKG